MDPSTDHCAIRSVVTCHGVTIRVDGELDLATAPLLAAALDAAHGEVDAVLVDIAEMRFCDAAGLRVLELALVGTRLRVRAPRLRRVAGSSGCTGSRRTHRPTPYGDEPS
jgi:anti-anti-sigma factor